MSTTAINLTSDQQKALVVSSTQATIEAVTEAVFNMASLKVGALITFEQHYSLQQYAERAISLNADVSRELFCDVCQAIFTEALKNLRNLHKESDVIYYLNNQKICAQENFEGYHFSKPEMEIGCEVFIGEYFDYVQKILIQRNPNKDTNITLINKFCYN